MNLLLDKLPIAVRIGKREYPICTDFRTSIRYELTMLEDTLTEIEKMEQALTLYYGTVPRDYSSAFEQINWFYRCGKEMKTGRVNLGGVASTQIYSFTHDDSYIYSAFLDQYGIDLNEIEYLHWWKFKALFSCLKGDNEFQKIMGYRAMTIHKDMSSEQKQYYNQMKELYKLPVSKDEQEKLNEIEQILLNGGDLSGIL